MNLTDAQRDGFDLMVSLIGDISEDYWAAGWLIGIEYEVWELVEGTRTFCGLTNASADPRVARIRDLRDRHGVWPDDESDDCAAMPADEFRARADARAEAMARRAAEETARLLAKPLGPEQRAALRRFSERKATFGDGSHYDHLRAHGLVQPRPDSAMWIDAEVTSAGTELLAKLAEERA